MSGAALVPVRFLPSLAVACLALPLGSAQWTNYAPTFMRTDVVDENYLAGYLTWNTKGGIAWNQEAESSASGPPRTNDDSLSPVRQEIGWNLRTSTAGQAGKEYIVIDKFTSDPTPRTLFLNASRVIQVNAYTTTTNCPTMDMEMWATLPGGEQVFVTGQVHGAYMVGYGPPARSGSCAVPFRSQTELDMLPQGSVLELHLIHAGETAPFSYFMSGAVRSALYLPFYTEEEAVFRNVEGTTYAGDEPVEPAASWVPLLAVLVGTGFAAAAPPRSRRAGLALVLLVGPLAGGCLGTGAPAGEGDAPTGSGKVESTFLPGEEGTGDTGGILGLVHTSGRQPIAGAHVSLLRTEFFTSSDARGQFALRNLSAGAYEMRIEAPGYRFIEEHVAVQSGNLTRVDVTMFLVAEKTGDAGAHRHDLWEGKATKPFIQEQVRMSFGLDPVSGTRQWCGTDLLLSMYNDGQMCAYWFDLHPSALTGPKTILPGTVDVEVLVKWGTANQVERVGVGFVANNELATLHNESLMYPKGNGVPTHIRTNFEMADVGHQTFTTWLQFFLYVPTNGRFGRVSHQAMPEAFDVTVNLHKGEVPLEPPHHDFWKGSRTLVLAENETMDSFTRTWSPKTLVPPGTTRLFVLHTRVGSTSGQWNMFFKPGNEPPSGEFKPVTPQKTLPNGAEYVIPLGESESDPFYAKRSNVEFRVDPGDTLTSLTSSSVSHKITLTAFREGEDPATT